MNVAYGDTSADIPILEMANHPVAVYPDDGLKSTALEQGWKFLGIGRMTELGDFWRSGR